jgi:hypothetical protein
MGLCVFLLICGPFAALLYFPLITRKQSLDLVPAGVSQASAGPASSAAKELEVISWCGEAEDHHRSWKSVA